MAVKEIRWCCKHHISMNIHCKKNESSVFFVVCWAVISGCCCVRLLTVCLGAFGALQAMGDRLIFSQREFYFSIGDSAIIHGRGLGGDGTVCCLTMGGRWIYLFSRSCREGYSEYRGEGLGVMCVCFSCKNQTGLVYILFTAK